MRKHPRNIAIALIAASVTVAGCKSPRDHRREADHVARDIIRDKQKQALGKTEPFTVERPADTLRRRLMLSQDLPHTSPASLGVRNLKPLKHWPNDDYLKTAGATTRQVVPPYREGPLSLGLVEALQVGAHNSNQYQSRKEQVFRTALDLDLERDEFRTTWVGVLNNGITADWSGDEFESGAVASPQVGFNRRLKNGLLFTTRLSLDLVKLLTGDRDSSLGIASDSSISMPLLRGAGRHIVAEPLTQAERDVLYAILE